ncbi:MAG TPA: M23 family metallopeptidase [Natronosporangium sp.]
MTEQDRRDELAGAVPVAFPLRGEWIAIRSPGSRIPSHGTDVLAQRYAFDLQRLGPGRRPHPAGWLRTLVLGVPMRECYGWGEPVHAALAGEVTTAVDGVPEQGWLHPVREAWHVLANTRAFRRTGAVERLVGNHVIVRSDRGYAAYVHLAPGSVQVRVGQRVGEGELLGRVGSTGNSTAPHLHLQLMDGPDPTTARPVPAAFRAYDVWRGDRWEPVRDAVPTVTDRIRSTP